MGRGISFVANRILNLLNQHLRGFRRILRRVLAHQRERHDVGGDLLHAMQALSQLS